MPVELESPPAKSASRNFPAMAASLALELRVLAESAARLRFHVPEDARLLKTTVSVCSVCLQPLAAAVVVQQGKVLMLRACDEHGRQQTLLENDVRFYRISSRDRHGAVYAKDLLMEWPAYENAKNACCGPNGCSSTPKAEWNEDFHDQQGNKSCTVLIEVTDACNLACHVCYADSRGDRILPFEQYKRHLRLLIEEKNGLDSVQITGGEASLHPQFWEILDWTCSQERISKVYLPTNGVEFSKPENVLKLKAYRKKLLVLLQLDGEDAITNKTLRAANALKPKLRLIKSLDRHGVPMQLTMTLAEGVSENEIAWVVQQGMIHRNIRLVAILPAFYTGRYEIGQDPLSRMTLSDAIKGVAAGFAPRVSERDFMAIPCSHPNCGWTTLFARRFGLLFNIAKHVDLEAAMNKAAYKTQLQKSELRSLVGTRFSGVGKRLFGWLGRQLIRPQDVFGIVVKPFMDRYTFDYDRVANCCHHILDTEGRLTSFCEYNVRKREQDDWQRLLRMDDASRRKTTAGGKAWTDAG